MQRLFNYIERGSSEELYNIPTCAVIERLHGC